MTEYFKQILTHQFDAALCMMHQCIAACPAEHWEGKIANLTFRQVAYHTLFFVDAYLTKSEGEFTLRDLNHIGGDERGDVVSPGLNKDQTLEYLSICRQKMLATLAAETSETLQGDCGFAHRKISRGELHIYNIRHVQHHAGQMSAYLRRIDPGLSERTLPWVGSGWR